LSRGIDDQLSSGRVTIFVYRRIMKPDHRAFASTPVPVPDGPWRFVRANGIIEDHLLRQEAHVDAAFDEAEVDAILDESFPASDPPPWTLGVQH
jgi:hypothetical protein